MIEHNIWIDDVDGDGDGLELECRNFALDGWSGGPLFGQFPLGPYIGGVMSGSENDVFQPTLTVFAGGNHMMELINFGRATWPA